ncbi:MAG: Gfo/Idh/MocA family oxidoreductase [Planctomycetes bacterium]|nr:Gfo/Idh/MocA family oxidoreductase [Planctomycetota bacterium]
MHKTSVITRRNLLKGAAAVALGAPYIASASALGAAGRPSASNRIGIAHIGVGGRGGGLMSGFLGDGDVQVLAVCDIDDNRRAGAKKRVDAAYSQQAPGTYAGCKDYKEFREVLDRPDVDGVVIATPDHWHGLLTTLAAKAGKDVYCEKPMASTIGDGRAAADAIRRYGRVFQTGSQERSTGTSRYACELVRNGRLGKIHTIRTWLPTGDRHSGCTGPEPVPEGLDYDRWLGPAPWAPYHSKRLPGNFRWIMDYSDGELTDRGAHTNDIALLGAGPLLVGPVEIEGHGTFMKDPLWDVPYVYHIEFTYANGLKIIVDSNDAPGNAICSITKAHRGIKFEGSEGWVFVAVHGGALEADPPGLLKSVIGPGEISLGRSRGHGPDWVNAIRTRGPTMAPAEDGHRTASFCHLCLTACLLRRKLKWDLVQEKFINDDQANRMMPVFRPARAPWHF